MDRTIDDLIETLDTLIQKGSGHINVTIHDEYDASFNVDSTMNECRPGTACYTPTIDIDGDTKIQKGRSNHDTCQCDSNQ